MAINGRNALDLLDRIGNSNVKGEYYLTDVVEIARSLGRRAVAIDAPEAEPGRLQQPRRTCLY